MAYWLIPRAFALVFDDADIHSFGSVVKNVAFSQDRVALTYEWQDTTPIKGAFNSKFTVNFSPWGLDNRTPLNSTLPGIVTVGQAVQTSGAKASLGTNCANCFSIPAGAGANFNPGATGLGTGV